MITGVRSAAPLLDGRGIWSRRHVKRFKSAAGSGHSYLDEFAFRFNRRPPQSRAAVHRVLGLAVAHDPVPHRDLVNPRPKKRPARTPERWGQPPSLEHPLANRP